MPLNPPPFITDLHLDEPKPDFATDAASIDQVFDQEDATALLVRKRTLRSTIALTAATCEWIAWRLAKVTDVIAFLSFIESLWDGIEDFNRLSEWEPKKGDGFQTIIFYAWQNSRALFLHCKEGRNSPNDYRYVSLLAEYVLAPVHDRAFREWQSKLLEGRMKKLWSVDPAEKDYDKLLGEVVIREAFFRD